MGLKARVKATGEIVDIILKQVDPIQQKYVNCETGVSYYREELVFDVKQKCFPYDEDYWTRLEHQYAGMAMQGMLNNSYLAGEFRKDPNNGIEDMSKIITKAAAVYAHALVEKMKEE